MKVDSRLSRSLGASLQAVHKLHYEFSDAQKHTSASSGLCGYASAGPRRRGGESLANLNLAHVGALTVTVKADFVVTDFA